MSYLERHQRLAYKIALNSESKFQLGAVLAKGSYVINVGINNMNKTHPGTRKFTRRPLGTHAEFSACRGVESHDIVGSTIYVCRVLKDRSIALAAPCECCTQFLRMFGVRGVYFSTNNNTVEFKKL